FSKSMFRNFNWWLVGAFVVTAAMTLLPIYVPFLRDIFFPLADAKEHFTLELNELLISLALAASTVPVFEFGKALRRASLRKKGKIV
ncbi:MAG: cation transporting ATPase C-terminal domain-containing protein, partial [Clostridia bacterium]|nr:cation transporting ATPase C-terminal domain-containing protein [Clostridia bacterium]